MKPSTVILVLLLATELAGCSNPTSPSGSAASGSVSGSRRPQPAVTGLSVNRGSTEGDAGVTLTGTGFSGGTVVTFGGVAAIRRSATLGGSLGQMTITFRTPPHAAGTVDVVVTDPGGLSQTLPSAFTYAPASEFDFNLMRNAYSYDGSDRVMSFEIENNRVVSVTCTSPTARTTVTPVPQPSTSTGAFSVSGDEGSIAGRMVSPVEAVGTIDVPACQQMKWRTYPVQ